MRNNASLLSRLRIRTSERHFLRLVHTRPSRFTSLSQGSQPACSSRTKSCLPPEETCTCVQVTFFFRKRTYVCIMHALENKPSSCMNIYVDVLWELSFINYSTWLPSSLLQKTCSFMHRAGPSSLYRNSYSTYGWFTLVICIINFPYGFFQVETNVRTLKEIRVRLSNKKFISKNIYIYVFVMLQCNAYSFHFLFSVYKYR